MTLTIDNRFRPKNEFKGNDRF